MTVLDEEQWEEFEKYMENPTCTEKGKELIRKVAEENKRREEIKQKYCINCPYYSRFL